MRIKSVTMITDSTGRRYAYPAVVIELPETPFAALVKDMQKSGWACVAVRGCRALFRRYSGRQEWRRYISVQN